MFIEPEDSVERMQPISDLAAEGTRHQWTPNPAFKTGVTVAPPGPDGRPNTVPRVGDIWYNSTDNTTYVYYEDHEDHAWLPIGGSAK